MDTEDESPTYFKYLNDNPNNFLLHSTEDGLNDEFSVEPIFTEIETSDWSSDAFPILLSGPLEDVNNVELLNKTEEPLNNAEPNFFSNTETSKPNNELLLTNDVLLQIKEGNTVNGDLNGNAVTQVINGNTYVTYTPNGESGSVLEGNNEIIQLLNDDGSVTTINKDMFCNVLQEKDLNQEIRKFEDFYVEIKANKCQLCNFLCESLDDIKLHLISKHIKEFEGISANNCNGKISDNDLIGTKMTSILNCNLNKTEVPKKKITMFLCSECGSGYSNKEDLKQHMINQHNLIYIKSEEPQPKEEQESEKQKPTSQTIATNLLKKQQKAMKKLKCSIKGCVVRFAKDELRKRHEECHVNQEKRQFQCSVCQEKFSVWRICSMHLWKCHAIDLGLLTCPVCNEFKSNSPIRVITHMAIHNEERPFICSSCGKGFKQITQLRNHEVLHRNGETVPNWFAGKQCEFCDRFFANAKCLKKHIASVHDKFKPFICSICGHKTTRKSMLQLHVRQHTGDKPHKCLYCDYKTGDHNCLRKHTMRHFGSAKYTCSYCNYQAIQSSAFKFHMANKHPGKEGTFSCNVCSYSTVNEAAYLSHVKCHEIEKNKKCQVQLNGKRIVEEETHNFLLNNEQSENCVNVDDSGGITIPAGFELQLVN